MHQKMRRFFVQSLSTAAVLASTTSLACSLVDPDPILLKQAIAKEIAYRLGVKMEQIRLDDITAPELHRPFELGAQCSGLGSYHYISGFRIALEPPKFDVKRMIDPTYRTADKAGKRARERLMGGSWWYGPGFRGRPRGTPIFAPGSQTLPPDLQAQAAYIAGLEASGTPWPSYSREPPFYQDKAYKRGPVAGPAPMRWPRYPREEDFLGQNFVQPEPTWTFMQMSSLSPPAPAQKEVCRYAGSAVILGFAESSPVAVNFIKSCGLE